jgi:hypothetical protein
MKARRFLWVAWRTRIKVVLLQAHAAFHRGDFQDPYKFIQPMQQAFDGIASVLFDAKLLTLKFMEDELRLLVSESAVAGGWLYFAGDEPLTEIFPGYIGHASTWERINEPNLRLIFSAEIAEWHSRILNTLVAERSQIAVEQSSPKALRDSYFAAFQGEHIVILDLCWASGQHYREWKRWIAGDLKGGSKPDIAFRRILSSGKRPQDYRAKPRPPKWK